VRGGDRYLTRRKAKQYGFLIEFGFQLRRFCQKLLEKMPEGWILNRLVIFVSLFSIALKRVSKALKVNVSIEF
jgi:hypothetical protein